MKIIITLLLSCISIACLGHEGKTYDKLCEVNKCWAEQKDISQLSYPDYACQTERDWIRIHLQLVEQTLRSRSTNHLDTSQKANRLAALDHLNEYWHNGAFPVNNQYAYRTPIFIDKHDNFCAVGYLVKATGYEDVSRMIAARTNLAYVREMNYPELLAWAKEYGFTVDELAWIQPGYPPETYLQNIGKGTDGNVFKLYADNDSGKLYVGGAFTHVDSTMSANNIAYVTEQNGAYTWHNMGGGVNGPVYAILAINGKVYVGGDFTKAGGKDAKNIAFWDGSAWNALGCIDGVVKDMTIYRDDLYVAGDFSLCDSVSEVNFACWKHTKWQPVAWNDPLEGRINSIYTDGYYSIILGGKFSYKGKPVNIIEYSYYGGLIEYSNSIINEVNDIDNNKGVLYAVTTGDMDTTKLVLKLGNNKYWGALYQYAFTATDMLNLQTICMRGDDVLVGGDIQYRSQIQPGPKGSNCGMIYQNQVVPYDGIWVDSVINTMTIFNGKMIVGGNFDVGYNGKWSYGALHSIGHWTNPTGVEKVSSTTAIFSIYPNPAKGSTTVTIEQDMQASQFRLTDINGRVVARHPLDGKRKIQLPLPQLAAGIYIAELYNEQGLHAMQRLTVQ